MTNKQDYAGLLARIGGRAAFCRDRGEIKTPGLLEEAAEAISSLLKALEVAAGILGGPDDFDGLEDTDYAIHEVRVPVWAVRQIRAAINAAKPRSEAAAVGGR